jgi:predicted transcriptional regulator
MVDLMATRNESAGSGGGVGRLGPLERSTMTVFWDESDRYLTVRQVNARLDPDLAYTTVMTLLSRLHAKGHLERQRQGRAWAYRPVRSRSEHAAQAMTAALRESDDHADALLHFVEHLTTEEQHALRRRLEGDTP